MGVMLCLKIGIQLDQVCHEPWDVDIYENDSNLLNQKCVHGNDHNILNYYIWSSFEYIYNSGSYNITYFFPVLCDISLRTNALGVLLYLETGGFIVDEWYGDLEGLNLPMCTL